MVRLNGKDYQTWFFKYMIHEIPLKRTEILEAKDGKRYTTNTNKRIPVLHTNIWQNRLEGKKPS